MELSNEKKMSVASFWGRGRVEAVGLQGSVQPDSGMLLLMLGSTLEPGNGQDVGGGSLAIKEKCQLRP